MGIQGVVDGELTQNSTSTSSHIAVDDVSLEDSRMLPKTYDRLIEKPYHIQAPH